jgi:hypothetical protein
MGKDFEGTGDEAADAARFAAVVAKPEFVEVDLEVSSTDGAVVRANPESPDQGNRVVGFLNRLPRSSGEPIDDNLPVPPATDRRPVVRPIAIGGDTVPSTDVSFDIGTASSVPSSIGTAYHHLTIPIGTAYHHLTIPVGALRESTVTSSVLCMQSCAGGCWCNRGFGRSTPRTRRRRRGRRGERSRL